MSAPPSRPTREQLQGAYGAVVPDLVAPGLRVLLVGINPSLWSGVTGYHFARPGNRLWRTLATSGLTPRLLAPHETGELLAAGVGISNLVPRATARLDDLLTRVQETGAELKGIAPLLVDFPADLDGVPVLLCWLEGDRALTWYHRADLGFAGRRPLPAPSPTPRPEPGRLPW